jgi:uncharacterized protein YjbI with pentapeptide repeats
MNFEDFTPFTPATFVGAREGAGYVMTVLVKAALGMQPSGLAHPLEEQLFPLGDTYPEGADPTVRSLAYASDLVPYKNHADVLLLATAYRPANTPTGAFPIGVHVGQWSKQLAVSGLRTFKQGIVSSSITEGEPLAAVPVTYEYAFGGPNFRQNPVGRGHKSDELPLIEYPDQRMRRPGDKLAPAGFGPISADWEPRKKMVGTFGSDYLEKYWPGFPGDFDARYFNAAPADQQVPGHLRGDEEIVLENLHPVHPIFATRLPGWRVVCTREDEDGRYEIVPLVIDTLWINPDADQLVMIWRGRMTVQTPDALEIKRLGFLLEELASPLREASYYRDQLRALIDQRDADFQPEAPPEEVEQQVEVTPEAIPVEPDEKDRQLNAQLVAIRAAAGLPPETDVPPAELPPLTPEAQARFEQMMTQVEAEDRRHLEEEEAARWTREKVIAAVKNGELFDDADLSTLDLSDCDFTEGDFRGAKLDNVDFSRSRLSRALLTGCSMERARLDSANVNEANLDEANLQEASLVQTSLIGASLVATDLTSAILDGANLSAAIAEQAILNGASLAAADLTKANLTGAVLSSTKCPKANFASATLASATCDHADFTAANFQRANMSNAFFTASKFNQANLNEVLAIDADLSEAELVNASLRNANCEGMWLSSAVADGANFQGASCVDLQVDGTRAKQANFSGCCITSFRGSQKANLSGANFRDAHGSEPLFESCLLDGADFSQTNIPGANFIHASVAQTNFTAADLKEARFDHANCEATNFATANLFQAVFAGANLNNADISGGNFYAAEFVDARVSKLRVKNCNLHMTKLEQWAAKNQ